MTSSVEAVPCGAKGPIEVGSPTASEVTIRIYDVNQTGNHLSPPSLSSGDAIDVRSIVQMAQWYTDKQMMTVDFKEYITRARPLVEFFKVSLLMRPLLLTTPTDIQSPKRKGFQ